MDITSPDHLQILTLGTIVYYNFYVKLFDQYSCYEYFTTFIKNVEVVDCVFLSSKIFNCHPKTDV